MKRVLSLIALGALLVSCGSDDRNQVNQAQLQNQNPNQFNNGLGINGVNNAWWGNNTGWQQWGNNGWQRNGMGFYQWGNNVYNPWQGWNWSRRNTIPRSVPDGCFYADANAQTAPDFQWPADCSANFIANFKRANNSIDRVSTSNSLEELDENIDPVIAELRSFTNLHNESEHCTHTQSTGNVTRKGILRANHIHSTLSTLELYRVRLNNWAVRECKVDMKRTIRSIEDEAAALSTRKLRKRKKRYDCRKLCLVKRIDRLIDQTEEQESCVNTRFVSQGTRKKLIQTPGTDYDYLYSLRSGILSRVKDENRSCGCN